MQCDQWAKSNQIWKTKQIKLTSVYTEMKENESIMHYRTQCTCTKSWTARHMKRDILHRSNVSFELHSICNQMLCSALFLGQLKSVEYLARIHRKALTIVKYCVMWTVSARDGFRSPYYCLHFPRLCIWLGNRDKKYLWEQISFFHICTKFMAREILLKCTAVSKFVNQISRKIILLNLPLKTKCI
jgi:hypothetical protein